MLFPCLMNLFMNFHDVVHIIRDRNVKFDPHLSQCFNFLLAIGKVEMLKSTPLKLEKKGIVRLSYERKKEYIFCFKYVTLTSLAS